MKEIKTYKFGYIIKENKALTIKKNLHSILYLNLYKGDISQFYFAVKERKQDDGDTHFMSP